MGGTGIALGIAGIAGRDGAIGPPVAGRLKRAFAFAFSIAVRRPAPRPGNPATGAAGRGLAADFPFVAVVLTLPPSAFFIGRFIIFFIASTFLGFASLRESNSNGLLPAFYNGAFLAGVKFTGLKFTHDLCDLATLFILTAINHFADLSISF